MKRTGGRYEIRDGKSVLVEEPTASPPPPKPASEPKPTATKPRSKE